MTVTTFSRILVIYKMLPGFSNFISKTFSLSIFFGRKLVVMVKEKKVKLKTKRQNKEPTPHLFPIFEFPLYLLSVHLL